MYVTLHQCYFTLLVIGVTFYRQLSTKRRQLAEKIGAKEEIHPICSVDCENAMEVLIFNVGFQ